MPAADARLAFGTTGTASFGSSAWTSTTRRVPRTRTWTSSVHADLDEALPFDDGSFDLVYANFVVEHLARPQHTFEEWRRVLKPDGALVLLTSNRASPLMGAADRLPRGYGFRSSDGAPASTSGTCTRRGTSPTRPRGWTASPPQLDSSRSRSIRRHCAPLRGTHSRRSLGAAGRRAGAAAGASFDDRRRLPAGACSKRVRPANGALSFGYPRRAVSRLVIVTALAVVGLAVTSAPALAADDAALPGGHVRERRCSSPLTGPSRSVSSAAHGRSASIDCGRCSRTRRCVGRETVSSMQRRLAGQATHGRRQRRLLPVRRRQPERDPAPGRRPDRAAERPAIERGFGAGRDARRPQSPLPRNLARHRGSAGR